MPLQFPGCRSPSRRGTRGLVWEMRGAWHFTGSASSTASPACGRERDHKAPSAAGHQNTEEHVHVHTYTNKWMYSHLSTPKAEAHLPRKPKEPPCLAVCLLNPNALTHTTLPLMRHAISPRFCQLYLKNSLFPLEGSSNKCSNGCSNFQPKFICGYFIYHSFFCQHWPLAEIAVLLSISHSDVFIDSNHGYSQPLLC